MACFSWPKHDHEQQQMEAAVAEVIKTSQRVSLLPSLRRLYAVSSTLSSTSSSSSTSMSAADRPPATSMVWEPLHVRIDKGIFAGDPLPLPLPSSPRASPQHETEACSTSRSREPLPILLDRQGTKLFKFDQLASACGGFSPSSSCCFRETELGRLYRCIAYLDGCPLPVAVVDLVKADYMGSKVWLEQVTWLSHLSHPNLCKFIGFSSSLSSGCNSRVHKLLVFEYCEYGNLRSLLSRQSASVFSLSWSTRVNIALGAAKGLAYLHEEATFEAVYVQLTAENVQIDHEYNAKLFDYGLLTGHVHSRDAMRRNVQDFGLILLELLVGTRNMKHLLEKKRETEQWIPGLLRDESKLHMVLDNELQTNNVNDGTLKSVRKLAKVALKCLRRQPQLRPTMNEVVNQLELVHSLN